MSKTPVPENLGDRSENSIILFDGVCNFCNGTVRFVIKRDPKAHFRFAPLQSDAGQELLNKNALNAEVMDSVIVIMKGKAYQKSGAALRAARKLRGLWPLLSVFLIIPRPIRDAVYDFIAARRYAWFGKQATCMVPGPEINERFLK